MVLLDAYIAWKSRQEGSERQAAPATGTEEGFLSVRIGACPTPHPTATSPKRYQLSKPH